MNLCGKLNNVVVSYVKYYTHSILLYNDDNTTEAIFTLQSEKKVPIVSFDELFTKLNLPITFILPCNGHAQNDVIFAITQTQVLCTNGNSIDVSTLKIKDIVF